MGRISSKFFYNDFLSFRDRDSHLVGRVIEIEHRKYKFQRHIGSGGFGAVYAAEGPDGVVAVKVIDLNRISGAHEVLVNSYLTEVRHLNRLRKKSRHIINIYGFDFDADTGRAYIVMELGGDNLTKFIARMRALHRNPGQPGSYLDPAIRHNIWRQLVSIVQTLTSNDIVHMDLKPDNLIFFGDTLKIIDLGISKKPEMIGEPGVGTLQFSAPEIMNPVDYHGQPYGPKADVWSLGAILYYMTYGEPPDYIPGAANPPGRQKPSRDFNLVDVLRRTLVEDPHARIDIFSLLHHPYTTRHL